jgi:hypothetical protein
MTCVQTGNYEGIIFYYFFPGNLFIAQSTGKMFIRLLPAGANCKRSRDLGENAGHREAHSRH